MAAKTVGFAIADEDRKLLNELVEEYGAGNRSEFLRQAINMMVKDRMARRLVSLQAEARKQMGGKVYTQEETQAIIKKVMGN
jgi:metal-responsive CopG/Arc/MetJ family transcriptional regulator